MFVIPTGEPHRNSNFGRRALRPAVDGTLDRPQPVVRLEPVKPGLTFHGLRHGHKTWMIADGVPEVAQARRLGHILGDRIQETYSHVAAEVETRLLDGSAGPLGQSRRRQPAPIRVAGTVTWPPRSRRSDRCRGAARAHRPRREGRSPS